MKTKFLKFLKFFIPIGLGLALTLITIWGLVGCEPLHDGSCLATNGKYYHCPTGLCSTTPQAGYSDAGDGIYCPTSGGSGGGSTGCQPKTGCPLSAPWLGGNKCFATTAACHAAGYSTCRSCN